ncbi:putative Dynein heavy chain N terminal region 2 domain1 [Trypanosoma vivax]|nr:putative Dynein heavy chain N terminal region 2 domain1 [Trypanosoma vivax]
MDRSGLVVVESQLLSIATRQLRMIFGSGRTTRGNGCVLFVSKPVGDGGEDVEHLVDDVQRLCSTMVREMTGRSTLHITGENQETDFSTIKSKGKITFNKFMTDVGAVDGMPEELDTITEQQHFQCMLGMLYNDVVSDMPCGARMVTDFPRALCPTGVRLDVVLGKSVCVQLYSSTETIFPLEKEQMDVGSSEASAQAPGPQMKVYLNLNALANAIASYATAPIENELPLQWRQKSFTLSEASEVLHLVHTTLSAFWRQNPHNDRTKGDIMSLISIVSGDLREYIKGHIMLEGSDWRGVWRMELSQLEKCLELIEKWSFITQSMSKGGWEGLDCEISKDSSLIMFERRMRDAVRIRQLLASASRLISGNAVESIVPENIFGDSSLLNSKETPEESWRECLGRFEKEFSFLEDQLRGRVKQLFGNHQRGMEDAISLWKQHRTLLQRDGVKSGIESEMNAMSDFLLQQLDKAHKRYENSKKRCSNEANLLRAAKGAQAEYAHMPETASVIFGSSTHLDRVVNAAKELITQAQKDVGEALTSWISSVETQCQKLSTLQDAVVFDGSDKDNIRCVVHPAVKQLMQDVSGMQSWCGEIPKGGAKRFSDEADGIVAACKRFVKAAARSTQIVCNYNTVRQQMLPCTRPMLEAVTTRTLSHLLLAGSNKRLVSVSNYQELDGLNTRLQNAVEALSADNRRIRRFHCDFVNQVISLHDLDLSTHTDQWRTAVDGMRRSFEDFLQANSLKHHEEWQRHLDAQIYKALEHQYQRALESMHDKMQGFKVELVFKQGQVHFKPNFEAIREAYYVQMRDLVSIPLRFRGLQKKKDSGGPYEMYKHIPFMNNDRIVSVHTKAIALFAKLARVKKAFRSHVLVGTCGINGGPDVDTLVEASCKSLQNFVSGFNVVREQMRKLGAIEDNMKVDGFTISNIPVKASIEEQLHRLEESLLNTLRKSMQRTLADIDDFVFNASNIISRQPVTIDEVGEASRAYNGFLELMPTYENKFLEVEEMNCVLKQETSTVIDISSTKSRWEHLREAMASHHRIINASMSKMRVSVEDMIQKHLKDGQRFSTKWDKLKQQLIAALKEEKQTVIQSTLAQLKENYKELEELKVHSSELEKKCECFQLPRPNLSQIDSIVKEATRTADMWGLYDSLNEALDVMRKEDWLTFRSHIYVFEDFIKEWRTKLSSTEKPSKKRSGGDEGSAIVQYLIKLLDCWSLCVPMLRYVRGEGMMTEHWNEMFRLLDMERGLKSTDLTFGHILERHKEIVAAEVELKQLHARVQGEVQIRDALQDLRVWALEAVFTLITPADGTAPMRVKLISEWKEIMSQVSDNQALIGSLKDSPFFSHFADEVNGWELKLATLNEALVHMNANQRKWTYLEPIFSRGALPQEQARFKRVDKEFVSILLEVEADPRVMTIAQQGDIVDRLKTISEQMDRCQKSLIEFLETKRESFPRFYFISDEDMLEILGHSKSPSVIQTHLKKLFMGIHSVVLSEDQKFITHMVSADKETVELKRPVSIEEDDVEKWLVALDDCMKETLKDLLASCVKVQEVTDSACIEKYPSQILQVALQVHFSLAVESAITSKSLEEVEKGLRQSLNKLTLTPSDVGVVTMLKVKALILDIIHQIEIIELLRAKRVDTLESWWWRKQLRYYMTETQECVISMVDTRFDYTYEYQGNAAKLVHTPLTDKCFLVLTKGMQLGYGGNPYGPAGTGKTESVKALGSAMGRQVLVFNCDEGIDFKSMGRIFMGIIKCGAWGCFDEFNRLKIDQLSAISQMIQVIQEAIKNREDSCTLLNRVVRVNRNSGIFVTLNPAGKGYGGRSKLPDNLRQLFREVAMTQPDNELITSTMLLSEGFTHARKLAKKAVELYRLSGQLMTKQQHYDWGLRSLKAVLRLAGSLVQKWKVANEGKTATEVEEGELILQSLSINMLSKLTFNDARLFKRLAEDVLPGVKFCDIRYDELEPAIETATKELGLQLIPSQVRKVLQLYEALGQRMGVVLVGPSGSGKSTLLRILRKALQVLKVEVPLHVMNPKAMSRQQLLGYMDPDTREWYDGVLSAAARDVVKQPKEHRPWILCDGDIDPEWIESLNSVLDDNKLLTLPNGVRIQFGNNVNFVFETHSLSFASPATVSRMGVILLSEEDVDLEPAVQSFLQKQSAECRELIGPLVEKYLIPAVRETLKLDALIVPTTPIGILNCCLTHVIHSVCEEDFVLSLMRGLCGMLNSNGSQSITTKLYEMAKMSPVSKKRPLDTYYDRAKKRLAEFKADMQTENASSSLLNGEAVVQTVDVQRLMATLEPLVSDSHYRPLFLVGPEGSGKSVTLQQCFANHSGTRISVLHCSAQTSSLHLIQKLEQLCTISSTSNGRVFRPKEGDRLVIILKNVNLPKPDKYGTVELHAFMMQLIMYNGFYNSDLEWIGVEKVQLVASMNPVISVGRYAVTPRLLAIVGSCLCRTRHEPV